ncbi:MAG: hypothetical protein IMF05_14485, partial [Proteobacteria bacterium]|nr:hypothetical protein [Pseudomonadota bacterium]
MQVWATIRKKSGREIRLTGILCVAAMSVALSGCEGQTQGTGSRGHEQGYEHELAALQPPSATDVIKAQRQLSALGYDV